MKYIHTKQRLSADPRCPVCDSVEDRVIRAASVIVPSGYSIDAFGDRWLESEPIGLVAVHDSGKVCKNFTHALKEPKS